MRRYGPRDDQWERAAHVGVTAKDNRLFVEAVLYRYRARASPCGRRQRVFKKNSECIGRSKGGPSTNLHATCDALGNRASFHLTPGQACDLDGADILLGGIEAKTLLADKGYDADARMLDRLHAVGIAPVIPPKSNRKKLRPYDTALYKARHLIKNLFEKLKHYRAIATRYDKTADAFLGAIHLAASVIWLN